MCLHGLQFCRWLWLWLLWGGAGRGREAPAAGLSSVCSLNMIKGAGQLWRMPLLWAPYCVVPQRASAAQAPPTLLGSCPPSGGDASRVQLARSGLVGVATLYHDLTARKWGVPRESPGCHPLPCVGAPALPGAWTGDQRELQARVPRHKRPFPVCAGASV